MKLVLPIILSSFIVTLISATSIYFVNPYEIKSENISERVFGFKLYSIPSRSMQPTLTPGDYIVVSRTAYLKKNPQKNDVIIFNRYLSNNKKTAYIKRVIAVAGDTIRIKQGDVFVNDTIINERYIDNNNRKTSYSQNMQKKSVPPEKLFVLGDNRDNSKDSRIYGFISTDDVIGKATSLLYGKDGRSGNKIK